jgi:hypothetical protein
MFLPRRLGWNESVRQFSYYDQYLTLALLSSLPRKTNRFLSLLFETGTNTHKFQSTADVLQ